MILCVFCWFMFALCSFCIVDELRKHPHDRSPDIGTLATIAAIFLLVAIFTSL